MESPKPFYLWRPHPWHGLNLCPGPLRLLNGYIEITPFDVVKYEVDKETAYLRVDCPQRGSSLPSALYGFIPRTYCGRRASAPCKKAENGDSDPLDICVVNEPRINRSEVIHTARVVGGLQMIDQGEADDKIIEVLANENLWGKAEGGSDLPPVIVERLQHYFSTYKLVPGQGAKTAIGRI